MTAFAHVAARPARSVIVICTMDRPEELELSCLTAHSASPQLPILVVDASSSADTEALCARLVAERGDSLPLIYRRAAESGLTRQRNEAIDVCRDLDAEIVHFIDDDTIVSAGYFDAIENRFAGDPDVAGIGGVIVNQPEVRHVALKSFFLLASRRRGCVLPSGRNVLGQYPGTGAADRIDWLSGCSMSYRASVLSRMRFDPRRNGSGSGEDYDFSFRVSRVHRLAVEPAAQCVHRVTPTARTSGRSAVRDAILARHRWVRENRERGMSLLAFWWATAGDLALHSLKLLVRRDPPSRQELLGLLDALGTILLPASQRERALSR